MYVKKGRNCYNRPTVILLLFLFKACNFSQLFCTLTFLSFINLQGCSSTCRYCQRFGEQEHLFRQLHTCPVSPIPRAHMNTSSLIKKSRDFLKVKEGDSRNPPRTWGTPSHPAPTPISESLESYGNLTWVPLMGSWWRRRARGVLLYFLQRGEKIYNLGRLTCWTQNNGGFGSTNFLIYLLNFLIFRFQRRNLTMV